MIARLVTKRRQGLAVATTAFGALVLAMLVGDDLLFEAQRVPLSRGATGVFVVAILYACAAFGPFLATGRRSAAREVSFQPGRLRIGAHSIEAGDVTGVAIARAARGRSVAVTRGSRTVFLEVDSASNAARVARALSGSEARVVLAVDRGSLRAVQILVTVLLVFAATLHLRYAILGVAESKTTFGLVALVLTELAFVLAALRTTFPRLVGRDEHDRLRVRNAYDEHVRLHASSTEPFAETEQDVPRVRVAALAQGDDDERTWLARLDAMPLDGGAYRGEAATRDVLWATLTDEDQDVGTRMAAARVLGRRYGEERVRVAESLDDPEVRARALAAMEDAEEAVSRLEALGPMFRGRR